MDNLGMGYGLGLTCSDYYNQKVGDYYPQILGEIAKVAEWLDSGQIVITCHSGEYQGIEYIDKRSIAEKVSTAYLIKSNKK